MSKNTHRIKIKLLAIFGRYARGKASVEEQKFVDKFYDHIGKEQLRLVDYSAISEEIKAGISQCLEGDGKVRKISPSSYLKVVAGVLIVGTTSFAVWYNVLRKISRNGDSYVIESVGIPVPAIDADITWSEHTAEPTGMTGLQAPYMEAGDRNILMVGDFGRYVSDSSPRRISNPTEMVFTFLLGDGTQVWLNSNAEIDIERGFGKMERVVHASGQVSFDIKKNYVNGEAVPFMVKTPLQTIEVLGTQFTVNTNEIDEESIFLSEGKVKLTHNLYDSSVILAPGEQAYLTGETSEILVADSEEGYKVAAWRKGLFHFEHESVGEVMEELAKWYGQQVDVAKDIREIPITGIIDRYGQLEDVLQIIQMITKIKVEQKGGIFYVTMDN